jgi:hypothetical protein
MRSWRNTGIVSPAGSKAAPTHFTVKVGSKRIEFEKSDAAIVCGNAGKAAGYDRCAGRGAQGR